jgi:hypothetical protein
MAAIGPGRRAPAATKPPLRPATRSVEQGRRDRSGETPRVAHLVGVAARSPASTNTYAAASKEITFDETGRVAFAGAAVADGSTATSRSRGSYAVKGWMATLHFDDGTERRLTALTSSDKPGGTLWLGGARTRSRAPPRGFVGMGLIQAADDGAPGREVRGTG